MLFNPGNNDRGNGDKGYKDDSELLGAKPPLMKRNKMSHFIPLPEEMEVDSGILSSIQDDEESLYDPYQYPPVEHSPLLFARDLVPEDTEDIANDRPRANSSDRHSTFRWREVARASPEAMAAHFRKQDDIFMNTRSNSLPLPGSLAKGKGVQQQQSASPGASPGPGASFQSRTAISGPRPRRNTVSKGHRSFQSFGQILPTEATGLDDSTQHAASVTQDANYSSPFFQGLRKSDYSPQHNTSTHKRQGSDPGTRPYQREQKAAPSHSLLFRDLTGRSAYGVPYDISSVVAPIRTQLEESAFQGLQLVEPSNESAVPNEASGTIDDDDWDDMYL